MDWADVLMFGRVGPKRTPVPATGTTGSDWLCWDRHAPLTTSHSGLVDAAKFQRAAGDGSGVEVVRPAG